MQQFSSPFFTILHFNQKLRKTRFYSQCLRIGLNKRKSSIIMAFSKAQLSLFLSYSIIIVEGGNYWKYLKLNFSHSLKLSPLVTLSKGVSRIAILGEAAVLEKFCNIHRKAPVLESLFNKVIDPQVCNFIKKRRQCKCFHVNIVKLLRTPILKNIFHFILLQDY